MRLQVESTTASTSVAPQAARRPGTPHREPGAAARARRAPRCGGTLPRGRAKPRITVRAHGVTLPPWRPAEALLQRSHDRAPRPRGRSPSVADDRRLDRRDRRRVRARRDAARRRADERSAPSRTTPSRCGPSGWSAAVAAAPGDEATELVVIRNEDLTAHDPAFTAELERIVTELGDTRAVANVVSPYEGDAALISEDGHAVLVPVQLARDEDGDRRGSDRRRRGRRRPGRLRRRRHREQHDRPRLREALGERPPEGRAALRASRPR